MADFDYVAAWKELAWPAYLGLGGNARDLFRVVAGQTENLVQGEDLLLPFPPADPEMPADLGDVRHIMEECIMPRALASAARVIYYLGHWCPGGDAASIPGWDHGACWKFANLADQVLREKCALPPRREGVYGSPAGKGCISYAIDVGLLRVQHGDHDGWTWEEIGLGTLDTLKRARAILRDGVFPKRACAERYHAALPKLKKACAPDTPMREFLELFPRFDKSKEGRLRWALMQVPGAPEGWHIGEFQAVNFKPHMYTITPKHIERSGITLNPDAAPCGVKGCTRRVAEHTYDEVLLVHIPAAACVPDGKVLFPEGAHEWLAALVEVAKGHKDVRMDGFVFVGR